MSNNMSTTETKIDAIREAIKADIMHHSNLAEIEFENLEKMFISSEEYKDTNRQFCLNAYITGYLRKIKEFTVDREEPLKRIENRIRFHAYQQRTKGELTDKQEISAAQAAVAEILEGYVQRFFEA